MSFDIRQKNERRTDRIARLFSTIIFVTVLFVANAFAFGSSYSYPESSGSIAAPIQIKDKGFYNLVVSIHFLREPYDNKIYKSDAYKKLIDRLAIEWWSGYSANT
jgi:hypothetical protein